jgi:serine/threonine protein kinase
MSGEGDKKTKNDEPLQDANATHIVSNPEDFPTMIHSMRAPADEISSNPAAGDAYATQYLAKPLESGQVVPPSPQQTIGPVAVPPATPKIGPTLPSQATSSTTTESKSSPNAAVFDNDIPGFVIEKELGRGAFGVVYCARDELLDRRVAIKKPLFSNPAHRQQYIDEARKAVKLDHPMIVPIYQVGMTTKGEPFVVQKLIEGTNLRQMLSGDMRLTLPQTIGIMRQVCMAVDAAHAAGIVHRDLKPENLLIDHDNRVFVADFGLAVLDEDENQSKEREVAGTPHYMSPEQFVGRLEWLDGRSDIWSLGIILYELLSGKPPFTGKNLVELKDQIKNKDPRPIHQRDPKIPSEFDVVFRKCCAKKMADRYSSARELMAALDTIAETLPFRETASFESFTRSSISNVANSTNILGNASTGDLIRNTTRGQNSLVEERPTVRNSMGGNTVRNSDLTSGSGKKYVWMIGIPAAVIVLAGLVWGALSGGWQTQDTSLTQIAGTNPNTGGTSTAGNSPPVAGADTPTNNGSNANPENASVNSGTSPATNSNANNGSNLPPVAPAKPFVVAIDGSGTHTSISKAIADSVHGESISIRSGTYRESLVLDRSLKLVGQGAVNIIATDNACLTVQADSQATLEGINLESQAANRNTIEISNGSLKLLKSTVFASSQDSYNCIKLRPMSHLEAEECKFQSTVHANISAEKTSSVVVRNCKFTFSGTTLNEQKRAGIQGVGARGVVKDCEFIGPCTAGIEWIDATEDEVTIDSSLFRNCNIGIQVKGCGRDGRPVRIRGTTAEPLHILNAMWGVSVKQGFVDIANADIETIGEGPLVEKSVGIQVTEDASVSCSNIEVRRAACGLVNKQSKIKIDNVTTRNTSFAGLLVDGGQIEGTQCSIFNPSTYGLVMVSKNASVQLDSLQVSATTNNANASNLPVYLASGMLEFKKGLFENFVNVFTVDPTRQLINATGLPERRTLIEVLGDPEVVKQSQSPVKIKADLVSLKSCKWIWLFNGPGSSEINSIQSDPKNEAAPRLGERLDRVGDDLKNFSVVEIKN